MELLAAVVVMVRVEVCEGVIEAGERLHVGGSLGFEMLVVTAQVRVIELLNPPVVVAMLIVEMLPLVAPGLTDMLALLPSVNPMAAELTFTFTTVVGEPLAVPVTVNA
jgi:hypothetical protein